MTIRILAFNTVTELCSVALMIDQNVYNYSMMIPRRHSDQILIMIDKLLTDADISLNLLDCIVFDRGPGSFVGVRLGVSIAKGLSLGGNLPLIPVTSLETLAQGAWRIFSIKYVITTINAGMNKLYWAHFLKSSSEDNIWTCSKNICFLNEIIAKKIICTLTGEWVIVGTGWNHYSELKYSINNSKSILFKKVMFPEAQDMLKLAMYFWNRKIFFDSEKIQLIYLNSI